MTRVEELATQFESITTEALEALEAADEASWQATSGAEGWTAAALAHHFSSGLGPIAGLVQAIATGGEIPPLTAEMLDARNAENAKANAGAGKQDVVALLKQNAANALSTLRQLSDDELQRSTELFGQTMSADQVAQNILIGHVQGHLESFRNTVG